jgi:hypothetical protein
VIKPQITVMRCITNLYVGLAALVTNPIKQPKPGELQFISPAQAIPNPLDHEAESYQAAVFALGEKHPGSIYEFAP